MMEETIVFLKRLPNGAAGWSKIMSRRRYFGSVFVKRAAGSQPLAGQSQ